MVTSSFLIVFPFWMDLKIREYVRGQIRTPLVVGAFLGRFENV